jgi:Na+-transporting NADH:ubiquinone oxidoreductase subunit NqrB
MQAQLQSLTALQKAIFFKDARNFQIVFLSCFLIYGIWNLGWDVEINRYTIIFTSCLITQALAIWFLKIPAHSLKSALITSLGLSILFKADSSLALAMGAFFAIASKFIIRINGKHLFNPANFGIVACILVTEQAWISPGQWGSSAVLWFIVGSAGLSVVFKVGRLDTSFAFLGTLFFLDYIRNILYLGWDFDFLIHKYTNGSLLLFTFFMITDPATTPNHKWARYIWSASVAVVSFILQNKLQVHTAPLWALFFVSPFTFLFDKIFVAQKFEWIKISNK